MIQERSISGEDWARALPKARLRRAGTQDRISQAILKHQNNMNTPTNGPSAGSIRAAKAINDLIDATLREMGVFVGERDSETDNIIARIIDRETRANELGDKCDEWTRLYADQSARLRAVTEAADAIRNYDVAIEQCIEFLVFRCTQTDKIRGNCATRLGSLLNTTSAYEAAKSGDLPPHPDTARLDWLENNPRGATVWCPTSDAQDYGVILPKSRTEDHDGGPFNHTTFRAAIDAARKGGAS